MGVQNLARERPQPPLGLPLVRVFAPKRLPCVARTEVEEHGGLDESRASLSLSGFEERVVSSGREEEDATAARQRNVKTPDLSGTDSEWEKVEDGR